MQVQWRRELFCQKFISGQVYCDVIDFIRLFKKRKRRHDVMDAAVLCYTLIIHFFFDRHSGWRRVMACKRKFAPLLENDTRWIGTQDTWRYPTALLNSLMTDFWLVRECRFSITEALSFKGVLYINNDMLSFL